MLTQTAYLAGEAMIVIYPDTNGCDGMDIKTWTNTEE